MPGATDPDPHAILYTRADKDTVKGNAGRFLACYDETATPSYLRIHSVYPFRRVRAKPPLAGAGLPWPPAPKHRGPDRPEAAPAPRKTVPSEQMLRLTSASRTKPLRAGSSTILAPMGGVAAPGRPLTVKCVWLVPCGKDRSHTRAIFRPALGHMRPEKRQPLSGAGPIGWG